MLRRLVIVLACSLFIGPRFASSATTVQSMGDAAITHDPQARTWTVRAGGAALTVALDPSSDWQISALVDATGRNWISGAVPDTWITANLHPIKPASTTRSSRICSGSRTART